MSAGGNGKLKMFTAQSMAFLFQIGPMIVGLVLFTEWLPGTKFLNDLTSVWARNAVTAFLLFTYVVVAIVLSILVRKIIAFVFYRDFAYFDGGSGGGKAKAKAKGH